MAQERSKLPVVVKIGGSVVESGTAGPILECIVAARVRVVIVPGGGAFADAVRSAQTALGFSDYAAHDMALLAMHQTALMMCDLQPGLRPAETIAELLSDSGVPVWLPLKMSTGDAAIPRDWSITSDGLAARLAELLGGAKVVLVKSCPVAPGAGLYDLVANGIADREFAKIVERARLEWRVVGEGSADRLRAAVA